METTEKRGPGRPPGTTGTITSLYLRDDLRAQIADRDAGGGVGPGVMIQGAAARYYDLLWRSRPTLEPAQWRAICDALNGTWLADVVPGGYVMPAQQLLVMEVGDAIRLSGLARKWAIDGDRLMSQLGALTPAQAESVRDVVCRFWARNGDAGHRITDAGGDPNAVPGEDGWRE